MSTDATSDREELTARLGAAEAELHTTTMRWVGVQEVPDLTLRQLQVLSLLRGTPGMSGQDLAEQIGVSTSTMSGIVDRIVAKGWIEREPDPVDRRRVLLHPTHEGLTVLVRLETPGQQARELLIERLDERELAEACRLAERLRDIAREIDGSGGPQTFQGRPVPKA
ncbi:MarR family winged helix-turn-helix transcriptional regulator [Ornithinimicrobium sufpigmenti]|uniref:MarR family winged helix-turn-helix transcriptional regulator n=1 Tax=Ornithinimicrobium sufpigmenti TaxID=2508882 RepID=UPI001035A822|nr:MULTISPECIES: MarR family transcriptional regulator [unclassified Ornithinimicrobium]